MSRDYCWMPRTGRWGDQNQCIEVAPDGSMVGQSSLMCTTIPTTQVCSQAPVRSRRLLPANAVEPAPIPIPASNGYDYDASPVPAAYEQEATPPPRPRRRHRPVGVQPSGATTATMTTATTDAAPAPTPKPKKPKVQGLRRAPTVDPRPGKVQWLETKKGKRCTEVKPNGQHIFRKSTLCS